MQSRGLLLSTENRGMLLPVYGGRVGIEDWLARMAGVGAYAGVLGREALKNGAALGRSLYVGHGTRAVPSSILVFEDDEQMQREGFTLYCPDPLYMPAAEDSSELSRQTRVAGIAFAAQCTSTAAFNFMQKANAQTFSQSLAESIRRQMLQPNSDLTLDMVSHYLKLPRPVGVSQALDLEKPGFNDLLFVILKEINRQHPTVGFRRSGVLGFDVWAVSLAKETARVVSAAAEKFRW